MLFSASSKTFSSKASGTSPQYCAWSELVPDTVTLMAFCESLQDMGEGGGRRKSNPGGASKGVAGSTSDSRLLP